MKDELISFETAKLAKEKGFDEEVMDSYHRVDGWLHDNDYPDTWNSLGAISAPTQALLQRWLREVHGVHVWARPVYDQDFGRIRYLIAYLTSEDFIERESFAFYESSEETLEKGLLEALKLI